MAEGSVPRFWREIPQRYNLIGNKCQECEKLFFPPRETCPFCRRKSIGRMKKLTLSGEGEIYTYTIIHESPVKFEDQIPYIIAIIKLREGPKITAQIVDCDLEKIKIGLKVRAAFRKIQDDGYIGAIYYGYKFVPKEVD